jgi:hypothetical protein
VQQQQRERLGPERRATCIRTSSHHRTSSHNRFGHVTVVVVVVDV